jgi:aspartyl-tRNA(Asn)/glutamyl-tRNA(Gln) amidotransferase subunit B
VTGELLRWMKERKHSAEEALAFTVSPERLAGLLRLLGAGQVSAASAKEVLEAMMGSSAGAEDIVAQRGLGKLSDAGALDGIVTEIVSANAAQAALYRSGKSQTFGWFVGQVMKKTGGRFDPAQVRAALEAALGPPA